MRVTGDRDHAVGCRMGEDGWAIEGKDPGIERRVEVVGKEVGEDIP